MSGPRLVALVGIDGSGKTTAAKALARRLRLGGHRARYFENAGLRPPLNWMAQRLGHADAVAWLGVDRFGAIEQRVRWAAMWRAVWWSRLPGPRIAVMDRYAPCQYAALRTRAAGGEAAARRRYARLPDPDLTIFLAVDPATAQRRVEERGRDREELSYLEAADAAYRSLPEWPTFTVVDAESSADDVLAAVSRLVGVA